MSEDSSTDTTLSSPNYRLYCLCYQAPGRAAIMRNRFHQLGFAENEAIITRGVEYSAGNSQDRTVGMMLGHLAMIRQFYEDPSEPEYGIFCENDVYIHRDIKARIPQMIQDFDELGLDILLMGFLFAYPQHDLNIRLHDNCDILKKGTFYSYYEYYEKVWGSQMYMISRKHAKYFLDKYTLEIAKSPSSPDFPPFAADWTLTKDGKRALIWPMAAVEDGTQNYGDSWQNRTHHHTFLGNITSEFI